MTSEARKHVAKAKDYVASGEEFYRKAAEEMRAAKDEGATWVEIADGLERSEAWVDKIVRWHESPANQASYTMPFSEEKGAVAKRHAKSVLANPEQRARLLEEMDEDDRLAVAEAAMKPTVAAGQRARTERRAVREERAEDPTLAHYRMIVLDLLNADRALQDAIGVAQDATWPENRSSELLARIAVTGEVLDLLRLAVSNAGGSVDWDAELERLNRAAEAAGSEA